MAKVLINDPIVNELAFDALFHLSQPENVGKLTARELRAIKNANTAKHYASQMSLDEKKILFAKIGMGYTLVIHDVNWRLKDWYKKVKQLSKSEQLKDASAIKLVMVSNRNLINILNVTANLTHSDGYMLNMDFHRVGHFINTWKDAAPNTDNIAEALDYAKMINKFAIVQNMAMKTIRGQTDISDLDLNILMYLYDAGARYVTRTTLDIYFGGVYKKTIITAGVKRLVEKSLIERNPTTRISEYQITSFGSTAVMEFHSKNLQAV